MTSTSRDDAAKRSVATDARPAVSIGDDPGPAAEYEETLGKGLAVRRAL